MDHYYGEIQLKELEEIDDEFDTRPRETILSLEDSLEELMEPISYFCGADGGDYFDSIEEVGAKGEEELDYLTEGCDNFLDSVKRFIWTHKGMPGEEPWYAFCEMKNGVYALFKATCVTDFDMDGRIRLYLSDSYENMLLCGMSKKVYELFYEETEPLDEEEEEEKEE